MTSISAPRITPEDIEAAIVAEHYFTARDGAEACVYFTDEERNPQ